MTAVANIVVFLVPVIIPDILVLSLLIGMLDFLVYLPLSWA